MTCKGIKKRRKGKEGPGGRKGGEGGDERGGERGRKGEREGGKEREDRQVQATRN